MARTIFEQAVDELAERMKVQAAVQEGEDLGEEVLLIQGDPDALTRNVLSGYVPLEDTDRALGMCDEVANAITRLLSSASSPEAVLAGLRMTLAQVLVIGSGTGKRMERQRHNPQEA